MNDQKPSLGGLYRRLEPGEEISIKDTPYIVKNEGGQSARVRVFIPKPVSKETSEQENHVNDPKK